MVKRPAVFYAKPTPRHERLARRYSLDVTIFHQRTLNGSVTALAVAGHRSMASGDKVDGIFQNQGEIHRKLQQVAIRWRGGFFPIMTEERSARFISAHGSLPINCLTF